MNLCSSRLRRFLLPGDLGVERRECYRGRDPDQAVDGIAEYQ
jgi:hypothetical protein